MVSSHTPRREAKGGHGLVCLQTSGSCLSRRPPIFQVKSKGTETPLEELLEPRPRTGSTSSLLALNNSPTLSGLQLSYLCNGNSNCWHSNCQQHLQTDLPSDEGKDFPKIWKRFLTCLAPERGGRHSSLLRGLWQGWDDYRHVKVLQQRPAQSKRRQLTVLVQRLLRSRDRW